MARLSQGLITSLANPSYGASLNEGIRGAFATYGEKIKERKQNEAMAGMLDMVNKSDISDPAQQSVIIDYAKSNNIPIAQVQATVQQKQQLELQRQANERQEKALKISEQNAEIQLKRLGLSEEQAERQAAVHAEWLNSKEARELARQVEQTTGELTQQANLAKGLLTVEGGRDKYINKFGEDAVGVYDSLKQDYDTKQQNLLDLRKNDNPDFSPETLSTVFDVGVEEAEGLSKRLQAYQKVAGADKTVSLVETLVNKQGKAPVTKLPAVGYVEIFKDAAYNKAHEQYGGWWGKSDEEVESISAQLALKAAQIYAETNDMNLATAALYALPEEPEEEAKEEAKGGFRLTEEQWDELLLQASTPKGSQ